MRTILIVVYLLIGAFVASTHGYLGNINGLQELLSAALAILLWPLVLLGVNLHIGQVGKAGKATAFRPDAL